MSLCDVDENHLNAAAGRHPKATKYFDFRQMLEKEDKNIDIVSVGTPDHIHAPASIMAMKMGKHCFCQKPLAHNLFEVRTMAKIAAEKKLATQMGTQIHARENYRRVVEIIQAGAIGPVHEVVVWCGKNWGGGKRPQGDFPVPRTCTGTCGWDRRRAALRPGRVPSGQLAPLVGLRHGHAGRHGVPLDGPAVLGAGAATSDRRGGGRPGRRSGDDPRGPDGPLGVPAGRRQAWP